MSTQEKPKKIKKPGRWRRRTIWTLSCLIIVGFVTRAVLPLALPAVMRKVAGVFGLTCTYDRLELNLFSGDAGIWGLEFKPKEGGAPILYTDYCGGNVSVLNLFKGKLNVWRVEADGVDVNIDRNADGHIPLLDRFVAATSTNKPAASPAPTPAATNSKPVDLASPLRIDALRLSHIRVHIHDRGVMPELDSELAMDLRLSDLGSTTSPAKFEMDFSADPFLDAMKITGEGRSGGKKLDASLHVSVRGVRLKPAAPYLAPLGIRPVADGITLTADGEVHTAPAPNNAEGFTGSIAFDHLSAKTDREEALALDHLAIDTGVIDTKSPRINSFIASGARATASRAVDGNLQIAGIEYDPALVAHSAPPPSTTPQPTPPLLLELMAERWSVGEIALKNARLDLHDQDIAPPVNLAFVVDDLSATSIDHDPKNLNTSVTLNGLLHAPGLIREIKLEGFATPFADQKHLTAMLDATGIRPDAIKPYLDQIGIESTLKDAAFSAAIDASLSVGETLTANANVTKFDFKDDGSLLSLNSVKVQDATVNLKTGRLGVADVELAGPGLSLLRDSTGELSALGLRTKARQPQTSKPVVVSAAPPATAPVAMALPIVNVGHFAWKGIHVDLEDQMQTPPTTISISDIGIEANDLSTDLDAQTPGHFKAWLTSPQIARQLEVDGNLKPSKNELNLNATVSGSGLDTTRFAGYLKPLGIEPVLRDGGLTLHAKANVTKTDAGFSASLGVNHLHFTAGPDELAGIDDLEVNGVSLQDGGLNIDAIQITRPHAAARRDADGTLVAGGIRILPPVPADPNAIAPPTPPTVAPATQPAAPFVVTLKKLSVIDSSIDWSDAAIRPHVATSAGATMELTNLTIGKDADPAILNLTAHATGSADKLLVTGKVAAGPSHQGATLDVSATGLRLGPLAPYLPPGIGSSLQNGRFHTTVDAGLSSNAAGGIGARLLVGPLDFRDGVDSPSLFQLDSVRVIVPRIDLPENALAVDELSVSGVQTHAEKLPSGELACMGLLLGQKTSAISPTMALTATPVVAIAPPPVPTTGPSVKDLLASAHKALPLITVEKLDLNVSKVTLTDLSRPASSPLVISDLRLHNLNRIDWLGKDAASKPATKLQFACAILPLVDHVQADLSATPFARQPNLQVDFSATGVHGNGLTELVPELIDQLDGTAMDNGTLSAHFEADAKMDRQSPIDFDVSHGFDLSFAMNKVQYRAQPDGPVLAGVDSVQSEGIRIVPAESIVHVKTLEIDKPIGLLTQDAKGIHALGWVYKLPTTKPVAATTQRAVAAKTETIPIPESAPAIKPAGEFRIDKLLISGLDFRVEDSSVDPSLVIPLNGLDVEVRNLSSLSPYEDKPIRFSAIVNADKVKLRKKGATTQELEDRDLFSQITANGEVSLYPKLHGWAKTSVSGLDLASLEGPAKAFGETLTGGLYDSDVDLKFDPTGAIAVTSKFTLTDLSLSEPPNGLIYRTLHLPAPLDVAIGAVEGADGSIALPINVNVNPTQISYADLGVAAAGGISQVIVTALAAAPLKAVNDVGGLIGIGGGDQTPENLTTTIVFDPGSAALGKNQTATLAPLIQKLHDDADLTITVRQQLGNGDLQLLSVRANPTPDQSGHLMRQLRTRKEELLTLRSNTAGKARAQLVSLGSAAAEPTLQQLRGIDRELADTEQSLDQIGELLRPGAARLADRRTRTAGLQLGADRLGAIKSALLSAGIFGDRVKIVTAQFNPAAELNGGQILISAVHKK